tara:strand:+ start:8732 stop:9634 length:903 start_codon:yes stop_codon:yes gene_type:complete
MFSCKKKESIVNIEAKTNFKTTSVEEKIMNLKDSNNSHVMVVSHRGDWRNAPENSIEAIQNCIKMGVDVVEIDVRKTKDKKLVIIHDARLDRTTTGKGLVSDWTLDSLQTIYLKNGVGHKSKHKIPTLKEALLTAKGHILINLDKCYDYFDEAYKVIKETGTEKQVIIKGFNKTVEDVKEELGARLDSIIFMPVVHLEKQNNPLSIIEDYQKKIKPVAIEIVFSKDTSIVLNRFSKIKENGSRVWVNSLWESLNAGYEDDVAVKHTDSIYGWYVKKGINMIQTDRPELLLKYLRSHGLHD